MVGSSLLIQSRLSLPLRGGSDGRRVPKSQILAGGLIESVILKFHSDNEDLLVMMTVLPRLASAFNVSTT